MRFSCCRYIFEDLEVSFDDVLDDVVKGAVFLGDFVVFDGDFSLDEFVGVSLFVDTLTLLVTFEWLCFPYLFLFLFLFAFLFEAFVLVLPDGFVFFFCLFFVDFSILFLEESVVLKLVSILSKDSG